MTSCCRPRVALEKMDTSTILADISTSRQQQRGVVMTAAERVIGRKFGRLLVVGESTAARTRDGKGRLSPVRFLCVCDCGSRSLVRADKLLGGHTLSCGCLAVERSTKHGRSGSPEYESWREMRKRCNNQNHKWYHRYGGRGISVCRQWSSFEQFLCDMGKRPTAKHSVDRVDNDGDYTPENCRWATPIEQAHNTSRTHLIKYGGRVMCISEWSRYTGIPLSTLSQRITRGWTTAQALGMEPR